MALTTLIVGSHSVCKALFFILLHLVAHSMAVDLLEYPWVVRPPITFGSTEELVQLMSAKIIAPAEEKHQERQKLLDELFN